MNRSDLYQLVLDVLRSLGGRARVAVVLDEVDRQAGPIAPPSWLAPHGRYSSRTRLYAAWEAKRAKLAGLIGGEWGIWELLPRGYSGQADGEVH